MKIGIVSFGYYFPRYRLRTDDVLPGTAVGLGVREKVVGAPDEDAVTLAVEAGLDLFARTKVLPAKVQAIYVGSESHPYAVNPTSSTVGQFLGLAPDSFGADLEFACKAGTSGLIAAAGQVAAGKIEYGLAFGSDKAQGKKGDILNALCAAGAAGFLIGSKKPEIVAEIVNYASFQTDTPDFWRRDGEDAPSHAGRFSGEPAYFYHITEATKTILKKTNLKIGDFNHVVFHQPNGKFPLEVAKKLGVAKEQLEAGLFVSEFGNPYSASSLLALCKTLEEASPKELILVVSYGSGAGSDALVLRVTSRLKNIINGKKFNERLAEKIYIT